MLFPYRGDPDPLLWNIKTSSGTFALLPQPDRPGGPVVFRSPTMAERFLRYYAARWKPIPGARVQPMPHTLSEVLAQWLIELQNVGKPGDMLVVFVDPRTPILPSHNLDADVLCLELT